uniref:Uncharacterized protein n=1 Tax=Panagrolaimus sp. PS1159 TaxID=55785 RepID=A0AC35FRK6_9BILA
MNQEQMVSRIFAQFLSNSANNNNKTNLIKESSDASSPNLPQSASPPPPPSHERSISRGSSNNGGRNSSSPSQSPSSQPLQPSQGIPNMEQFNHLWQMMLNRNGIPPPQASGGPIPNLFGNPIFPGIPGMNQQEARFPV